MKLEEKSRRLAGYIRSLTDFEVVESSGESRGHMGALITNAILQPGLKYVSVVLPRVRRIRDEYPQAATTSGFLEVIARVGLTTLLKFENGPKPPWVLAAATFFKERGVETIEDLRHWLETPGSGDALLILDGVGYKTADYFRILAGLPATAIDRHLLRFLESAGVEVEGYHEAQRVVHATADLMAVNLRTLDHSIWKYMSAGKATRCAS